MTTALIALICLLLCIMMMFAGYYIASIVVHHKHRIGVLEDSYREATEHITNLEREVLGLNQQLEHAQYEMQLSEQRGTPSRAWNPKDILNSTPSR